MTGDADQVKAATFRIDNPLDPANRYLQHSFVESPDMKNIYDGVIRTDGRGYATVRLPRWFQALNQSFRYQLTTIRSFARAIVWREVRHNSFVIRTASPRVKVSWQVTGVRHDAYARAHRIKVDIAKAPADRGRFLSPRELGKPAGFRSPAADSVPGRRQDAFAMASAKLLIGGAGAARADGPGHALALRALERAPAEQRDRIEPVAERAKQSALDLRGAVDRERAGGGGARRRRDAGRGARWRRADGRPRAGRRRGRGAARGPASRARPARRRRH